MISVRLSIHRGLRRVKHFLEFRTGTKLMKSVDFEALKQRSRELEDVQRLLTISKTNFIKLYELLQESSGQLRQDLWILSETGFKRGGFFVEFGAADGHRLSNTHILEKGFGWEGIVAEPARIWRSTLISNRQCSLDFRCVWHESGRSIEFVEVETPELSTTTEHRFGDLHSESRSRGTTYEVETVSLNDLLLHHQAPTEIDYVSIDTEGSEYTILQAFDFDRWSVKCFSIEHNHTDNLGLIRSLLARNGYEQVFAEISDFDAWFIRR